VAKNKMADLRDHLFETLEALKDADAPMDLGRAKAISEIAQTIINSAKVEVELIRTIGSEATCTEFFGDWKAGGPRQLAGSRGELCTIEKTRDAS
jgi:hypothetical protein